MPLDETITAGQAGHLADHQTIAAALNAAAGTYPTVVNVLGYGATGDGVTDDTAAIQAAIDALPTHGGQVWFPRGDYVVGGIVTTKPSVELVGAGNVGQSNTLARGGTRILVKTGTIGMTFGTAAASNYGGPTIRNLHFVDIAGTATGGVLMLRMSNWLLDNVAFSGFLAGYGMHTDGTSGNAQYGSMRDPKFNKCLVGLKQTAANGTRIFGGMFDGNDNAGTVGAGTTGIQHVSGDTLRCFGTVFQYLATAVDLQIGLNHELHGCRFEGFTTAVKTATPDTRVEGGSFNNTILGGGGTAFNVQAAATNTYLDPGSVVQVGTLLTDAGTRTHWGKTERLTFGAAELTSVAGGANPNIVDIPDGRIPGWELTDGAAKGAMATMVSVPVHWITFSVTALWISATAAPAGNVRWRLDYAFLAAGSNVNTDYTAGGHTSVAEPAQYILTATNLGNITNVPGELLDVMPLRRGDDGANDTCANTVYLVGIQLDRVT